MREHELYPDARNLMESTRSIGYSLPAAVADIVDNSIAAGAACVQIDTPTGNDRRLLILDDGVGMDKDELFVAMRYGSRFVHEQRREGDLGRFGLGLKMASLSQCRCLTVLSKKKDGTIVGARWDLDHIAESAHQWALLVLSSRDINKVPWADKLSQQESGTLVVWEKLDQLLKGIKERGLPEVLVERTEELMDHLSLVFHRYLEGEGGSNLTIEFNGGALEPADPFLKKLSQRPFAPDTYHCGKDKILIQPFILPHPKLLSAEDKRRAGDLQKDQGFYVYRNKRLVIWGTWFRLSRKLELSKLARVMVDIPASADIDDQWSLDVKKSNATIPEELKESLRAVVRRLSDRSGQVWKRRARVERSDDAFWNREKHDEGYVTFSINMENPTVKDFLQKMPELKSLFVLLSAALPLDSIYTDLASNETVTTDNFDLDSAVQSLKALGIDDSAIEGLLNTLRGRK